MIPRDGADAREPEFDRVAAIYRALEYAAFGRALETARFFYLDRLRDCRDILIIGEGDGRVLQRITQLAPEASIRCIDTSGAMLARARARLDPSAAERVSFERADAREAPVPDAAYDAIVTMFVLDCFTGHDVERLVRRLLGGLRANGLWLFADFAIPESGWPRLRARAWVAFLYAFFRWRTGLDVRQLPDSEAILQAAGLSLVESTTLQRGLLRTTVYAEGSAGAPTSR